jgi:hypothetical protein
MKEYLRMPLSKYIHITQSLALFYMSHKYLLNHCCDITNYSYLSWIYPEYLKRNTARLHIPGMESEEMLHYWRNFVKETFEIDIYKPHNKDSEMLEALALLVPFIKIDTTSIIGMVNNGIQ